MKIYTTINEFKLNLVNEGIIKTEEIITHEIEYDIDESVWTDNYNSEEELAENIITDLELKTGYIDFSSSNFTVKGQTKSGLNIEISQSGEYDMYGGPYDPKMKKPVVKVNGHDIYNKIRNSFNDYGWTDGEVDISRTDIWNHVISTVNESVNASAKEELKRQFYELEALSKLDPWDIIAVLNELKLEFSY